MYPPTLGFGVWAKSARNVVSSAYPSKFHPWAAKKSRALVQN